MQYQIVTIYEDGIIKTEAANSIVPILEAAAIYLRDPACWKVRIYDLFKQKLIFEYENP